MSNPYLTLSRNFLVTSTFVANGRIPGTFLVLGFSCWLDSHGADSDWWCIPWLFRRV